MASKDDLSAAATTLARLVIALAQAVVAASSSAEAAEAARAAFEARYAAALALWSTKKATFIGFLVKLIIAYLTDHFLLEPLARALALRLAPGALLAGSIAAIFAPLPVIVAECAIAVRYARAKTWEERFGTNRHATRWLALGIVVAVLPATVVIALSMLTTVTASILGWPALAGRQALNIVLGIVSFALHCLLLFSGETPRDLVDAVAAVRGRATRERATKAAEDLVQHQTDAMIDAATRYEALRTEHETRHGALAVYPFPQSVLELVQGELPDFARPRHDTPGHARPGRRRARRRSTKEQDV